MKALAGGMAAILTAATGALAEIGSEYTSFDSEADCTVIARSAEGDGDWSDLVCPGFANYPFVLRYSDGRESITYGFSAGSGMATMGPFNHAGDTIEWRVRNADGGVYPFAAIQRWLVARSADDGQDEILVVSKVGQPSDGAACVMAYIQGSGVSGANERAREIADGAQGFECGTDRPQIDDALSTMVSAP